MNKIQSTVMNKLLDKYENSRTFCGDNKVQQKFSLDIGEQFPRYRDDAEYEYFLEVNDSLSELEEKKYIFLKKQRNGTNHLAVLNLCELEACYSCMSRKPRREENKWLLDVLKHYETEQGKLTPIYRYIEAQKCCLAQNKKVQFYDGNREKYKELLEMSVAALQNEDEMFIRDFSIRLFQDSKRAEQLESNVASLLYQYGDYEEKDSVLEECGIVKTPTYVMMKGNVKLTIGGQKLDLSGLNGDISLSTVSIRELDSIQVLGTRVVTIENLTSFHDYKDKRDYVIYLGGFHNKTKRRFICFLYEQNREKEYRHFGDIDAGGFYILEHLKQKTNIAFRSLSMDTETLLAHESEAKRLTQTDRVRLRRLRDDLVRRKNEGAVIEDYLPVLDLMLERNWKLEQEAVN